MWHTASTPLAPRNSFFLPFFSSQLHVAVSLVPIKGAPWQIIFVSQGGPWATGLSLLFRIQISGGVIIFSDISAKPSGGLMLPQYTRQLGAR